MFTVSRSTHHQREIVDGERFAFGENWAKFLAVIDEQRIKSAVDSLREMLEIDSLEGKSFLDVGSGSGLFSLAAKRLGAKVLSFDCDLQSVACTSELKGRHFENDGDWLVQQGSVLDKEYLKRLGNFDIVYSWGVLHHTGNMWAALDNIGSNVADRGKLFMALYNDQGGASKRWASIKRLYNKSPGYLKGVFAVAVYLPLELRSLLIYTVRGNPSSYFSYIINYADRRGMSWWRDKIDWIGGYPFEVSTPEQIFAFYKERGYTLNKLTTAGGGHGCNQFVFQRNT